MSHGHRIMCVQERSIAEEVGIGEGDFLLKINETDIVDIIDYIEWMEQEDITLLIRKTDGEEWEIEIEKDPGEDLGITFESDLIDRQRNCSNRCIFCFVDQLPQGMRESLYCKDDDWRLSFLVGNYITLTNMTDRDIQRIVEKRISPLYISIHTTNPALRRKMLHNRRGGDVLRYLKQLEAANIQIHCQIVLCPGWNDECELENTLKDLWNYRPMVQSTAVVPVGLTRHRERLEVLSPFTADAACAVIDQVEAWQDKCRTEAGTGFVFAADEFYILAGRRFPAYEAYEEFPQLENGVGLVVRFRREFEEAMLDSQGRQPEQQRVTVVTGQSAYHVIREMAAKAAAHFKIEIEVVPVENHFFGRLVTVSGLVTGQDILTALEGRKLGARVLLPQVMLRRGQDVFLDDLTLTQLSDTLGVPVTAVPVTGEDFLTAILGG